MIDLDVLTTGIKNVGQKRNKPLKAFSVVFTSSAALQFCFAEKFTKTYNEERKLGSILYVCKNWGNKNKKVDLVEE